MSEQEKDAIVAVIRGLWPYLKHRSACEIDQTDFCTCGFREAREKARQFCFNLYIDHEQKSNQTAPLPAHPGQN